jgi:hypothetical protein
MLTDEEIRAWLYGIPAAGYPLQFGRTIEAAVMKKVLGAVEKLWVRRRPCSLCHDAGLKEAISALGKENASHDAK